jgi:ribulose-bisphosphate carboxylase large chain
VAEEMVSAAVSGERFSAVYRVAGPEERARAVAEAICLEQTVELPARLLPPGNVGRDVVGRLEDLSPAPDSAYDARVSFAVETTGGELPQLLNVLLGNVSLMPGVRLIRLEPSPSLLRRFGGPRFGRDGVRRLLGVADRPLLATALKPMGTDSAALARMAFACAMGGIDLVKDDHGLANQPFAPWRERVARCAGAVAEANAATGRRTVYLPTLTAPHAELLERAHAARALGAGGLLVCPGLVGWDAMRTVAADDTLALPVMSHPAGLGPYVLSPASGVSHAALFGQLMRLAGADAVIYPHTGGRFAFTESDCRSIADATAEPMGPVRPSLPVPAGGMRLDRLPELRRFYGDAVVFLIGGDLLGQPDGLRSACERLVAMVSAPGQEVTADGSRTDG